MEISNADILAYTVKAQAETVREIGEVEALLRADIKQLQDHIIAQPRAIPNNYRDDQEMVPQGLYMTFLDWREWKSLEKVDDAFRKRAEDHLIAIGAPSIKLLRRDTKGILRVLTAWLEKDCEAAYYWTLDRIAEETHSRTIYNPEGRETSNDQNDVHHRS